MPTITYDRGHHTNDFDIVDLASANEVEVVVDHTGKLWVNLNGKCLLRVGHVAAIKIEDGRVK